MLPVSTACRGSMKSILLVHLEDYYLIVFNQEQMSYNYCIPTFVYLYSTETKGTLHLECN